MRSLNDAVYSKAQAGAGKRLYEQHCISCHPRGYFGQVLATRRGETLSDLFEVMVALMPQNAPGSLSDREYLDITAYIMSVERYPEGDRDLALADLKSIEIQPHD